MPVVAFDHVAVPSSQPEQMLRFYRDLGFTAPTPQEWRSQNAPVFSVHFGDNKINFHAPALWERGDFTLRGHSACNASDPHIAADRCHRLVPAEVNSSL